jgi:predicted peptidase
MQDSKEKMMITWVLGFTLLALSGRPAHPDVVARFDDQRLQIGDDVISYRLHVPDHAVQRRIDTPHTVDILKKEASVGLVIWFHGRGESGADNTSQLGYLEWVLGTGKRELPSEVMILALQCPAEYPTWIGRGAGERDRLAMVEQAVAHVGDEYWIDPTRIYAAGVSDGASACWEFARRNPGLLAAILPMGTCELPSPLPESLRRLRVWAFQAAGDGASTLRYLAAECLEVTMHGGAWALTAVDRPDHDCWTAALQDYGAWEWLLLQRRNSSQGCPPGTTPHRWRMMRAVKYVALTALSLIVLRVIRACGRWPSGSGPSFPARLLACLPLQRER